MGDPLPSIDPDHESKRAVLSVVGGLLAASGALLGLLGLGLFVSVFFAADLSASFPRAVVGIVLAGLGGFALMPGLWLLSLGNMGRMLRYQAGETLPVAQDAARQMSPVAHEVTRGLARSAREGWEDGGSHPPGRTKVPHACGAWNDPDDHFCKGCGQPLPAERICPTCRAHNDPDSRYCDRCGAELAP